MSPKQPRFNRFKLERFKRSSLTSRPTLARLKPPWLEHPWFKHPWFQHLRLKFNLLLAPIFLWGAFLAGGDLRQPSLWLGLVALQLFLYGGATAFNSYYDRDEGPIGGMLEPPPVDPGLLPFSLLVQALGLLLALPLGGSFVIAWLLLALIFTLYSHPLVRLKARPAAALAAIALGQGAVGFAAGWLLFRPELRTLLEPQARLGMLSTALIVSGLYIVTQSYQSAEDRARGDRTLPVLLGPARALYLAVLLLGLGGAALLLEVARNQGAGWAVALGLFFALLGLGLIAWARRFDEAALERNFRSAMRFASLGSAGLGAFILWQLVARSL